MSMDEWNLRMRAQKEQDRKKKTESAEMLRGYRGGVKEEDLKLAALRAEERNKKQDAERLLHSYRKDLTEEELHQMEKNARKEQGQQPLPPLVNKGPEQHPSATIAEGSVSALAANFNNSPSKQPDTSAGLSTTTNIKATSDAFAPPLVDQDTTATNSQHQSLSTDSTDVPMTDGETMHQDRERPFSSEEKKVESSFDAVPHEYSEAPTSHTGDFVPEPIANMAINTSDEPLHDHPTIVRLDVNFTFGLITATQTTTPECNGYMMAVEEIVQECLDQDHHTFLSEHATYNPSFGPFVQDCQWDGTLQEERDLCRSFATSCLPSVETVFAHYYLPLSFLFISGSFVDPSGRWDVRRALVTASVPVFLANGISISAVRQAVIKALQEAIHSGRFLTIAQRIS